MGDADRRRECVATRTHTHSRLQSSTYGRACVRSQSRGSEPRGRPAVISPLRVGRHMPPMLLFDGVVRGAGSAEAGRVGHNFQIYVQMFLSRSRTGCGARVFRGEDAYRKVSRRIEKCSRGFFARAMMERGVDQPRRENRPFTSDETTRGWRGGGG